MGDLFRTLPNIYNIFFSKNSQRFLVINLFRKKAPSVSVDQMFLFTTLNNYLTAGKLSRAVCNYQ